MGRVLRTTLAVWGAFVFFTSLDLFAFEAWSGPRPAYLVYGYCLAVAALVLVEWDRPTSVHRSPLALWIFFFLLLTVAWGIGATSDKAVPELVNRVRSMALLAACLVVFDEPRARRLGVTAVSVAVVVVSLVNLAELLRLVEFPDVAALPRVPGRAAGPYGDANIAGHSIALGLALAVPNVPRPWRVPLLILGAAAIGATFSRGAGLCLAVLFAWLLWQRALGAAQLVVTALAVSAVSLGIDYLQSNDLLTDNTAARVAGAADDSGRTALALKAWEAFAASPWTGSGLGSTNAWPKMAHNTFLTLAAEHGVLGLVAFPALAVALAAGNRAAVGFALVLMTAGLFSHTIIQARPVVLLLALAAATPDRIARAARTGGGRAPDVVRASEAPVLAGRRGPHGAEEET